MMSFNNFIQIAGITYCFEAKMLINCGINYLGFPLRLPANKDAITEVEAGKIIKFLVPPNF